MLYITYVCPNEGMELEIDGGGLLFISHNTTVAHKLHYYSLFFLSCFHNLSSNYCFI